MAQREKRTSDASLLQWNNIHLTNQQVFLAWTEWMSVHSREWFFHPCPFLLFIVALPFHFLQPSPTSSFVLCLYDSMFASSLISFHLMHSLGCVSLVFSMFNAFKRSAKWNKLGYGFHLTSTRPYVLQPFARPFGCTFRNSHTQKKNKHFLWSDWWTTLTARLQFT